MSAPTGKAADNIDGATMHGTYVLPMNQEATAAKRARESIEDGDVIEKLRDERLANLQNNFCDMCGHLIDEVSSSEEI